MYSVQFFLTSIWRAYYACYYKADRHILWIVLSRFDPFFIFKLCCWRRFFCIFSHFLMNFSICCRRKTLVFFCPSFVTVGLPGCSSNIHYLELSTQEIIIKFSENWSILWRKKSNFQHYVLAVENFVKKKYVLASGREKWRISTEERGGNLVQIRSSISVGNLNIMRNNVSGMSQIYIFRFYDENICRCTTMYAGRKM